MLWLRWTASQGKNDWWSSFSDLLPELYGCVAHTCAKNLTLSEKIKHEYCSFLCPFLNFCVFWFEATEWTCEKKHDTFDLKKSKSKTNDWHPPRSSPYLTSSVEFICEFDFTKGDRSLHPVRTEVWRVRMNVHTAGSLRFRFASRDPLPVHVFPPVVVRGYEVQQNRIHGVRVQSRHVCFQHGKHAPLEQE